MSKLFNVGQVTGTHGIKGEVKIIITSDNENRFTLGERLYVKNEQERLISLTIIKERIHKNHLLLQFEEISNLTEAEKLKGKYLMVKEEQLPELPENEYYIYEILDCEVYTLDDEYLGKISNIFKTGANDVWEITTEDGKEHLIPFIDDVVKIIQPEEKRILIELMEGLLE